MSINRYVQWQKALRGEKTEERDDETIAGFYRIYYEPKEKSGQWYPYAVFYKDDKMYEKWGYREAESEDQVGRDKILESYAKCSMYPVSHEVYTAALAARSFEPLYQTRMSTKQQDAGTIWTPKIGQELLAAAEKKATRKKAVEETKPAEVVQAAAVVEQPAPETAENERAVIGDNSGFTEPLTADQKFTAQMNDVSDRMRSWLASIGGKVTTDEQEKVAAGYAREFDELRKSADEARAIEKKPVLEAGKAIDAKWRVIIDAAALNKGKAIDCAREFVDARRKREAEERREAERKIIEAKKNAPVGAVIIDTPVAVPTSAGGFKSRKQKVVIIDDIEAVKAAFIASPTGIEAATEWAKRAALTMTIPGTHVEEQEGMRA